MNESMNNKIKESVLERLEREGITPRSRLYWLSYEYAFWGAWLLSVVLGAVALAVLSFTSLYIGYSLYEATHQSFLTFFFDTLPYLWFLAFAGLTIVAYFNLRNTKRGYKYPLYLVVGSSFGFSVVGAVVLHSLGAGFYLDHYMGQHLKSYQSRAEFEAQMWQNPLEGRLLGVLKAPSDDDLKQVLFTDVNNEDWDVTITELRTRDAELLLSGHKVRMLVATTTEELRDGMIACAVFPWILDAAPGVERWRAERKNFIEDVEERRAKLQELVKDIKEVVKDDDSVSPPRPNFSTTTAEDVVRVAEQSPCSNHPVFRRERN
ncbi:hypothetical protein COU14_01205 [Candidatus Kaiserbacteria bacterium CG10_big_fil_rev_8_21_14_0_10_44_10]|uniref:Uncharacterized protein n=1 Tax=Candidatus Kaiserbacteria bacterium CG10_big_fil_rev_8_21_14_0_10_44_10 TaxID=1974606 RepID=A0A2H0UHX4_9BACT|nr:MAG: hypothetical protein COU14_01205 [Candidatus Kaiserbacteria bacterium CG10_big_fil_rev_8_21_14_0_10_44_10]